MTTEARIHDLGYRRYEGPRSGVGSVMADLGWHAIQRVLGLKRAARHKIVPVVTILLCFVPALVFVGMAALLPTSLLEDDILPSYAEYYGFIVVVIWLFTSFVAPEAICTDRRTGMLALYLATPLTRTTYVVSKLTAVITTILMVSLLPSLFLLLAYTVEGAGPDGVADFVETLGRISVAGLLIAIYFGAYSAMVSSFTPRRSMASAAIVISFLMSGVISTTLIDGTDFNDRIALINVATLPIRASFFILGEQPEGSRGLAVVNGSLVLLVTVSVAVASAAVTWWRYQRLEVDR
ncbi:MAG: ABC transporter permease [Acidimicrobiales bacterium]